ncbi:MAG: cupin domain-containing protein [Nitratireductor sp.]|jgi:mannose-6-phosphate isomerase-like protein (cupin superfamily)
MRPEWYIAGKPGPEVFTGERCFITELLNSEKSPDVSLALARVEPGVTTQLHRLDGVAERYIVRKGRGTVEIDGRRQRLGPGDQVMITAGAAQRIANDGPDDLEFYCLCTPRFTPACYFDLEDGGGG